MGSYAGRFVLLWGSYVRVRQLGAGYCFLICGRLSTSTRFSLASRMFAAWERLLAHDQFVDV